LASGKRVPDLRAIASRVGKPTLICIEQVSCGPRDGRVSAFSFGRNFGALLALPELLDIPCVEVRPQVWKAAVLGDRYPHDKAGAIQFVRDHHPLCTMLAKPRSRVPHHGIADAVCIAHYGARST
jgi:hypothetical protein